MAAPTEKNVFVGSENGILKYIDVGRKSWSNCSQNKEPGRDKEICAICWKDETESEVVFAQKNKIVKIFNVESEQTEDLFQVVADGNLIGLCTSEDNYITASANGLVNVWDKDSCVEIAKIEVGDLHRIRADKQKPGILATGGKENDLKLWNLENVDKPIFQAKNLPHDWLNLRVPIWVTDMHFLDNETIVVCTGYHQVRLYDPRGPQRRPVLNFSFGEYPFTSMTLVNQHQVVVGDTVGKMALIDLRQKGSMVQLYKGFSGGVTSVEYHPKMQSLVSTSLDRHVRIHDVHSKKLKHKFYMKSRLKSLLLGSDLWKMPDTNEDKSVKRRKRKELDNCSDDENEDNDELWDKLQTTGNKKTDKHGSSSKKKKKT